MLPEYQVLDNHFIWRTENGAQTLVAYVFDPGEALIVAGMLNAALGYAALVMDPGGSHSQDPDHLKVAWEEMAILQQGGKLLYTWDGETDVAG